MTKNIDIVFADGGGPANLRFVEVEDGTGRSISAGEWIKREDGYFVLRLDRELLRRFAAEPTP